MFIGFNQGTTLKNSSVEKDLKYAEKYGFDYIEFQMEQLYPYLENHTLDELNNFFNNSKIKPYSLNALVNFNLKSTEEFNEIKKEFIRLCKIAKKINCSIIVIVPAKNTKNLTIEEIKIDSVNCIFQLTEIADKYDIKIAYEYLGFSDISVNNFSQCYDIVETINKGNVGIELDCFHFYISGSKIEDLLKVDVKKMFAIHINDSKNLPLDILQDSDRLWPGEGIIPLDKIFDALKQIKFDGVVSIELFNPEYWKWDAEKTIKIAKEKTEKIFGYFL